MALSPNDGETFLKEVDDELRKEQVNQFFMRYGWWVLAAAILFLAGIGGFLWWQSHKADVAATQGETLLEALDSMEAGNRAAAAPKLAALAQSNLEGYRAAALFSRANSETAAGNAPAAIATLRSIAQNEDFDQAYRDAALIRQTTLEFDTLAPAVVVQRLRPLARPGSPWLGSAGEMVGIAYIKMRRANLAAPIFAQIGCDEHVPSSIRTRAIQMAGSLGVGATGDACPRPSQPAAARE